jgi:two-component system phosphate regulon sensor histidine kinase PhoR
MNKKLFAGIIVLMGISILGIIAVQLIWMNNAIRVKNELFNRSVNEALNNTVEKLENLHNFGIVNHMVFDKSMQWRNQLGEEFQTPVPPPPPVVGHPDSILKYHQPVRIIRQLKPDKMSSRIEIKVDAKKSKSGSVSYQINSENENDVFVFNDQPASGNAVFIFNNDTLITDVDSLYKISVVKIDSMLTRLDTLKIMKPDISQRAFVKANRLKRMANQVVTEISEWDVNNIDEEQIQKVLTEELQNRNIPIEFEFGVLKDSAFIVKNETVTDSLKLSQSEFQVNLYPNDIFQKNIRLALWFPGRESFIYRSLNWLLVASFLFSLIILTTFGLSVFYILRQKKISEMKSDFINNMTHEFKTPIATISVATDSILNEKVVNNPEKIRYFAGMIKKENNRMNRQVEDILTISRLDRKDFEFKWETVDVHELINDALQSIILQIEKRGGKVILELNAANPLITTDLIHCTNVVYNLLDNAIKYSVNLPEIKITTANNSKGVLIAVEDKGIGMTKAVQSKIFERFYRQTSGNIHNVKGFGLGLNYVKAVLEANRGNITVQSEPGKGSRFEVFLPKSLSPTLSKMERE